MDKQPTSDLNPKVSSPRIIVILGILSVSLSWVYGIPGIAAGVTAIILGRNLKNTASGNWSAIQHRRYKRGIIFAWIGTILSGLFFVLFVITELFNKYSIWDWEKGLK